MLCCIAEIVMFVFGIIALVKGNLTLSKNKVVQGGPARLIGVLLLLPLILGMGGEIVYGVIVGTQEALKGGGQPADFKKMQEKVQVPALIIHAIGGGIPFLIAVIVGVANAKPAMPKEKVRREAEEYMGDFGQREEDDEPPRRRPDDRFRAE